MFDDEYTRSTEPRSSRRSLARGLGILVAAGALLAGCESAGEEMGGAATAPGDTATFIVRLGTDTTAVERFRITDEGVEAVAITRVPETTIHEASLLLGSDGAPRRYEAVSRDPGEADDPGDPDDAPVVGRTTIAFTGDSAVIESTGEDGETETTRVAAPSATFPQSFNFFSLYETIARRGLGLAGDPGADSVWALGGLGGSEPAPIVVRAAGPDSVTLEVPGLGIWRARHDGEGRILGMHAGALGRTVERTAPVAIDSMAAAYAVRDARGEGMGPLSPRDTAAGTADGATIEVDYSRPSARGRTVFGGLVPYGEVWRTGANQATGLTTDRPLEAAGTRIPAGAYSIFTIPGEEEWTVIVNEETGQAGTAYDESRDLARIPAETAALDTLVETFTIRVDDTPEGGVLRFLWEHTEARLPFRVVR